MKCETSICNPYYKVLLILGVSKSRPENYKGRRKKYLKNGQEITDNSQKKKGRRNARGL